MNSYENPELSESCDLYLEIDRLRAENAKLREALAHADLKSDFLAKLAAMNDAELFAATTDRIWLSAYASNNKRGDYHWQHDACYDECMRRDPDMYSRAWKVVADKEDV